MGHASAAALQIVECFQEASPVIRLKIANRQTNSKSQIGTGQYAKRHQLLRKRNIMDMHPDM
eukprot:9240789-Karenia_brevis.AAC.1